MGLDRSSAWRGGDNWAEAMSWFTDRLLKPSRSPEKAPEATIAPEAVPEGGSEEIVQQRAVEEPAIEPMKRKRGRPKKTESYEDEAID